MTGSPPLGSKGSGSIRCSRRCTGGAPDTYIYETFGRFPATVDTMHLMWFMQVHHLDLDFYDRFFKAGAYGQTHRAHMSMWHS